MAIGVFFACFLQPSLALVLGAARGNAGSDKCARAGRSEEIANIELGAQAA